jgi:hypothetical protein
MTYWLAHELLFSGLLGLISHRQFQVIRQALGNMTEMKPLRKLSLAFAAAASFVFIQPAMGQACNTDSFLGAQNLGNSGLATEEAALEALLSGQNAIFDVKLDQGNAFFHIQVCPTNPNQFYINVAPNSPGYFVLKFGTGGTTATADTFFFTNIAELTELVFTTSQVQCLIGGPGCPNNTNTGRLSHYTLFNGNQQAPEPGTLALLGIGIIGVALVRRRRMR